MLTCLDLSAGTPGVGWAGTGEEVVKSALPPTVIVRLPPPPLPLSSSSASAALPANGSHASTSCDGSRTCDCGDDNDGASPARRTTSAECGETATTTTTGTSTSTSTSTSTTSTNAVRPSTAPQARSAANRFAPLDVHAFRAAGRARSHWRSSLPPILEEPAESDGGDSGAKSATTPGSASDQSPSPTFVRSRRGSLPGPARSHALAW